MMRQILGFWGCLPQTAGGLQGQYDAKIAVLAGFCLFFGSIAAILLGKND
jgi:hypothetical protein